MPAHSLDYVLQQVARGDPREVSRLQRGIIKARGGTRAGIFATLDRSTLGLIRRTLSSATGVSGTGSAYRNAHKIATRSMRLSPETVAFGGPDDATREEHSAFCFCMDQGFQERFLDRHPGEEPEDFIDRPRKVTFNVTRLVIDILSQLYKNPPVRTLPETTHPEIRAALEGMWGDLYNYTLLCTDRFTRLVGTTAVRPFYDPDAPGRIRLWTFLSHQLRVIPDPQRPWLPEVVIERMDPYAKRGRTNIWTRDSFLTFTSDKDVEGEAHGLGRIPHVFFKDGLSFTSFFVEGRGRGLCDQNATINNKLTDLNEIVQLQGFSVVQVVNPEEDDPIIGPRRATVFRPVDAAMPYGIEFKTPGAPIAALRADVEADTRQLLRSHRIPDAVVGLEGRQAMSGIALRQAMAPIFEDLKVRARLFAPLESDLADSALRVRRENDEAFEYSELTQRPDVQIDYQLDEVPLDPVDQVTLDEHEIAHGVTTPPDLIQRKDPSLTWDEARSTWEENLALLKDAGFLNDEQVAAHAGAADAMALLAPPPEEAPPPPPGPMVGQRAAAEVLGVAASTVNALRASGKIRGGVRVGNQWRIPVSEIHRIQREGTLGDDPPAALVG